jgi:hypothetical protein
MIAPKNRDARHKTFVYPGTLLNVEVDIPSQEVSCEENFELGSLLRIHRSTIIPRAPFDTMGQQSGLSRAAYSESGRRADLFCGSVAIVCVSRLLIIYDC